MTKRRAIQGVVFLLLGAIVNVAVAWGLVHFAGDFGSHPVLSWNPIHDSLPHESDRKQLADLGWQQIANARGLHLDVFMTLGVSIRSICEETGTHNRTALAVTSAGWPCLAVRGLRFDASSASAREGGSSAWKYQGAIPRPKGGNMFFLNEVLPWHPIWPGFAINTLFYAVILWLLTPVRFLLPRYRRLRRITRGLCPACAYPTGTSSVCTECGGQLPLLREGEGPSEGA